MKKNELDYSSYNIAELGSGGSLALGYCFLLAGAKSYTILEEDAKININENLILFDQVLQLFKAQNSEVPVNFHQINLPEIYTNTEFRIDLTIISEKSNIIRNDLQMISQGKHEQCALLAIVNKWESTQVIPRMYDLVLSRAVMEHVKMPDVTYRRISDFLNKGGFQLHDIEFHSHGLTPQWDGHYYLNPSLWKFIYGRRPYFLNRFRLEEHKQFLENAGNKAIEIFEVHKPSSFSTNTTYGAGLLFKKI